MSQASAMRSTIGQRGVAVVVIPAEIEL